MPKEGAPLLKLLKSRSASQRRCLIVYRSGLAVSFVLWKAVVCERRKLVVRSFLQENQKAGHNVNVTSDPSLTAESGNGFTHQFLNHVCKREESMRGICASQLKAA
jgi:hypothetical protein